MIVAANSPAHIALVLSSVWRRCLRQNKTKGIRQRVIVSIYPYSFPWKLAVLIGNSGRGHYDNHTPSFGRWVLSLIAYLPAVDNWTNFGRRAWTSLGPGKVLRGRLGPEGFSQGVTM